MFLTLNALYIWTLSILLTWFQNFLWFTKWNDFRITDWTTKLKYPELVMKETQRLLAQVA